MRQILLSHPRGCLAAVLLALSLLLPQGAAAYDFMVDGLCYDINEDSTSVTVTLELVSSLSYPNLSGDLVIPEDVAYSGTTYSVTSIGYWAFSGCSGLTSVTIPNSVTSIGEDAFYGCSGLTSVTIPNSVTAIGIDAFSGCSGLTSVIWNAKSCADFTFQHLPFSSAQTSIQSFTFGDEVQQIPAYLCFQMTGLTSVTIPNSVTAIGKDAFSGCSGLTSVTIGNSVTSIGDYAFSGCSGLTGDLTIPNSVTSIGHDALWNCSGLTSVTIGNSVTSIGDGTFKGCSGLTSVTIGNSVSSIDDYAFDRCSGLTSVIWNAKSCADFTFQHSPFSSAQTSIQSFTFGDEVQQIPAYLCCQMTGLTSVIIPNSVTSIGNGAFYGCGGLTSVTIGNSVTSIGDNAFQGCSGLTGDLTIGNSVTSIGDNAFNGCSGLTGDLTIPNSVTSIGIGAFLCCSGLTSVTIGNSMDNIEWTAFEGCNAIKHLTWNAKNCSSMGSMPTSNIETITIGSLVETLPTNFVRSSKITSLTIPNSVTSIGACAFYGCSGIKQLTWNAKNCSTNGTMTTNSIETAAIGSGVEVIPDFFLKDSKITSVTIPSSVKIIGSGAFSGCVGLTSITIPNSVTDIGDYAFQGCSGLTTVAIPNSITSISYGTFCNCSGLTSVTIPNSITSIGNSAFYNCSGLTSVTIPNSVTSIGDYTFSFCYGLTSFTIPSSVTSIGYCAFYNCDHLYVLESLIMNPSEVTVGNQLFSMFDDDVIEKVLLVPTGTRPLYLAADIWKNFGVIHEPEGENDIKFVDPNAFRLCVKQWDTDQNGNLSYDEAAAVTNFYGFANHPEITSFEEFQYFTSLTSIGDNAFSGCTGLASLPIPNTVEYVGQNAFLNTPWYDNQPDGLVYVAKAAYQYKGTMPANTSIVMRDGTHSISHSCFTECSGLTSITIPSTMDIIERNAFAGCNAIKHLTWNAINCGSMGDMPKENIETVNIGSGVELLPNDFVRNSKITSVTIPNSVTSIGPGTFTGCSGLTSVTIGTSVSSICLYEPENAAFLGCNAIKHLTWNAKNCSSMGSMPTSNIETVTIGSLAETLPTNFVQNSKITAVTIPSTMTSIGNNAFAGCSGIKQLTWSAKNCSSMGNMPKNSIETVSIGNQVVSLPHEFVRNSKISSVTIPNSVTTIGGHAFRGCNRLSEINIPNSVRHIGNYAFYSCVGFTSVTIPESTDTIASYAFGYCSALADVTFQGSPKSISGTAFYQTPWEQNQGEGLIYIGTLAYHFNWSRPENITVTIRPGTTAIADYCFSYCSKLIEVTIPNSVTSIGQSAFTCCSGLTSVTIPNSVTSISKDAFSGCSGLTSVTIPNSVTSIGDYAFYGCSGLTSVTIPSSVTAIGSYAFRECSGLTSVTIPSSVTAIGSYAFRECSGLETITVASGNTTYDSRNNCNAIIETSTNALLVGCNNTVIPNSVTSIDNGAFYNCTGLTTMLFPNSVTSIGGVAFYGCSGLTSVFCLGDLSGQTINPGNSPHGTYVERIAYVPVNLVEAYKSSYGWSGFTIKSLPPESLYGSVITHTRGDAEVDFVVPIGLFNQQNVTAVSFDMHLPDGVTMLTDEYGQPLVTLDEMRRSRSHGLMVSPLGNNSYRIKTSSTSNASLKGSLGYLFYASVQLDRYHGSGNEYIVLDNVTATPTGGTAIALDTLKLQLALDYLIGDVDADLVVDVADYVATNAHIMQRPIVCFYADAADCDNNTIVDAADLVAITRYALGRDSKTYRQIPPHDRVGHEASLWCDESSLVMAHGETRELVMNITSDIDLAALQLDIVMPAGMQLAAAHLGECANALCVDTATLDNGEVRLLASAFSRDSVPAGQVPIHLTLTATDGWQGGELNLHNAIVVGNDLSRIELDDLALAVTATTSVMGIKPDQTTCLKVVGNKVITDTPTDGTLRIISVNGQVRTVLIKAGHNELILDNRGAVIIELNGTTLKAILP